MPNRDGRCAEPSSGPFSSSPLCIILEGKQGAVRRKAICIEGILLAGTHSLTFEFTSCLQLRTTIHQLSLEEGRGSVECPPITHVALFFLQFRSFRIDFPFHSFSCCCFTSLERRRRRFIRASASVGSKLGEDCDRFGDYLCVVCDSLHCASGHNQIINTKFTKPITKISKSSWV